MADIEITDNFNKSQYNNFLSTTINASVFQTLEMAEVYSKYLDTDPLILVAIDKSNDEILASLLAKKIREKKGYLQSLSLHSTIRGGPIFKPTTDGIKAASLLLKEYNNRANKWGPLYSRIYPLFDSPELIPVYEENGYKFSGWNNFIIDLKRPVEDVWSDISKSNRKNINNCIKSGVVIEEIDDKKALRPFYSLLAQNYQSKGYPLEGLTFFEYVFEILYSKGMAKFFVAKYNDEYAAVRAVLIYKGVIYDWHTGSLEKYNSLKTNNLIVWHILKWGAENGYSTFDFGGGGEPEQLSEGWVEFKRRFGGALVSYGRFTKVHKANKLWIAKNGFRIYKQMKQRYNLKNVKMDGD